MLYMLMAIRQRCCKQTMAKSHFIVKKSTVFTAKDILMKIKILLNYLQKR